MTEAPPRRIAAFVEDFAHQQVIGPLIHRVAAECGAAVEFAEDIVGTMDLERAARDDASLKHFLDDLRTALRSLCR